MGEISRDFEIAHSSIETSITVLQVTIGFQSISAFKIWSKSNINETIAIYWFLYQRQYALLSVIFQLSLRIAAIRSLKKDVKKQMQILQHHDNKTEDQSEKLYSLTGNSLRKIVNFFTGLALSLIAFVIVSLVTLVLLDEMTWTILTNNFALVLGTVTSNMILLRIQKVKTQVIVDEHKVIICESALLLKESLKMVPEPKDDKVRQYSTEVQLYLRALTNTDSLPG